MVTAEFNGCKMATARQSLYQYDYEQQLQINGLALPKVFQADFCNAGDASTVSVLGENGVVDIPAQFIADGRDILAYVFYYDAETGGKTRAEITITVMARPERTDEQPTPEQESIIDQAIDALNTGVEEAKESAEDSEAWAVGERGGEPVQPGDPAYHNNAKYWAEEAHTDAPVTSVNGQTGEVNLNAEDVGALPESSTLDDIPDGATYKRATAAQLRQIGTNAAEIQTQSGEINQLQTDVDAIERKIPNQASAQNQLADKDFVNSSINSAAAYFRGAFPTRAALFAVPWQTADPQAENYVSNNDYAYVADDETHNDEAWRYIYVLQPGGTDNGWQPQFKVNESPLTAAQLAALNSGATAALIAQITANETAIQGKQAKITASGLLKGDGQGGVSAATPGTDYVPPSDYAPEVKTSAMTQPVGKDASGKLWTNPGGGVTDVKVNGTSIVQGGVANIPMASASTPGVVISGTVTVTGTTPTIAAIPGVRYVCGEVTTLDITLPASGIVDVTFDSGSTATVLTITPPTGQTLKWANGFDPASLDADTTYEINIMDGLGVAVEWT